MNKAAMTTFMGLPGSGKTTIATALAEHLGSTLYVEPEEPSWPEAVSRREQAGYLTAITWFRSVRVPMLYRAAEDRDCGRIAVVDSSYDALLSYYLGSPGMEWLIAPTDPYFEAMAEIAAKDTALLPTPTCLVFVEVALDAWTQMLSKRDRALDKQAGLADTYPTQNLMLSAARTYCEKKGIPLLRCQNDLRPPKMLASEITVLMQPLLT